MRFEEKIENYLKNRWGKDARLEGLEPLGKGVHGSARRVTAKRKGKTHRFIVKTLAPSGFGHDHYSDRAQVLLLAHDNYNDMDRHVRSIDVVGETADGFVSVGGAAEFYIFMEEAPGTSYFTDLDAIVRRGRLAGEDPARARQLSNILLDIHSRRYEGPDARTLYRRRIRDLVGHGECVMGIVDAYGETAFTDERELVSLAGKCLEWWGRIRNRSIRLCRVHGDFHPGNIRFHNGTVTLLDRSRGSWGEAADDVSCLALNYIYYALKDRGGFGGPFAELFKAFFEAYTAGASDEGLAGVLPPFFAFRALVLANPAFYPDDSLRTRRKLLNFGRAVLEDEAFDPERIPAYLEGT